MSSFNQKIKKRFSNSNELRAKSIKGNKLRVGPEFIRIGISKACNFNCITCWSYSPLLKKQIPNRWKKTKIDKNLVFNLIDDLAEMECIRVLFSGVGEPFTHPNIINFIKRTRDKGILVYLQTNLSLVNDVNELADCLGYGNNLVCVNLSAATKETYVKIYPNQTRKSFYKLIDKISVLRDRNVPVRLVYVVNRLNYKEIPKVLNLNKKLKSRLHLELMDYEPKEEIGKIALNEQEKKEIIQTLLDFKKQKGYESDFNANIDDFINQLTYLALGLENLETCSIGYFFSTINEQGLVSFCCNRHRKFLIGDLNKKSFKDIWSSQKYEDLRVNLAKGNFLDVCQNCIKKRGYNFKLRAFINPGV